jgi:transposase-like protein
MAIDFKGAHYPKAVIVHAVFFYVRSIVILRGYWPSVVWPSIT